MNTPEIEAVAQRIFESGAFNAPTAWVKNGNSFKQDEARAIAVAAIQAMKMLIEDVYVAGMNAWDTEDEVEGAESYTTRIIAKATGRE